MCTCLLPDPPITYFSQLLRCLILWVKTKKVTLVCEKFYQVTCHFSDCPRLRISSVDAISGQSHFWPWALSVFWLWNHQRRQTPPASLWCLGHSLSEYLGCLQRAPPSTLMCPSVHTEHEHAGSVWAPVGLTAYHGQIGLKNLAFPVVVSEWAQPLPSSGPLVDLSGCLQPLWPSLLLKTK